MIPFPVRRTPHAAASPVSVQSPGNHPKHTNGDTGIMDDPQTKPVATFAASRRQILAGGAGLAAMAATGTALAQDSTGDSADFLFVQTAKGMAFDASQNRLTLRGVSPVTLFFADRPERMAGNMTTERFVPFWSEGTDSFLSDPPNADLSVVVDGTLHEAVVVLRDPVLQGEDLHYTVQVTGGEMPVLGENASLFIDIIGMPLTPVSFAGVRRRAYRRAVLR